MRYTKGSVALNGERDIPILKIVRNARAVTTSQLLAELFHRRLETSDKSAYWRIRRLVVQGFLAKLSVSKTMGEGVYAVTSSGLEALELRGHYLLALSSETRKPLADSQASHMVEVNAIRLALMQGGILADWKCELEIVSENLVDRFNQRKDFDGIATIRLNGRRVEIALEFERTVKSSARYREIARRIQEDPSTNFVLYLASNEEVLSVLAYELHCLGSKVAFALTNQFKEQLLETRVLTVGDHSDLSPLVEILRNLPEAGDGGDL